MRCQRILALFCCLFATSDLAAASVLCSSRLGHVHLRERCRPNENPIDLRTLGADRAIDVPLSDWVAPQPRAADGLESVATANDATMLGLDPCRLVDTRPGTTSEFVGDDIGALADHEIRTYTLTGLCEIPTFATALSINLAIVPGIESGFASVGPSGAIPAFPPGPNFASINYEGGAFPLSNSLIVPLDGQGRIDVYVARSADVIVDTNGFFQPKDADTRVYRLPGTGTPTENGQALIDAVTEINSLGAFRYAVELGPGAFDLGTTNLSISKRTALFGAGQMQTTITCDCDSPVLALLTTGEVRDLHVDNTSADGASPHGISIASSSHESTILNVYVTTADGDGIRLTGADDVSIEHTMVDAADNGIYATSSTVGLLVQDSRVSGDSTGVFNGSGSITIDDSTITTTHASNPAVDLSSAGNTATIRHARLLTGGGTYVGGTAGTLSMTHTFLAATTLTFTGTASCAGTSGATAFFATGCP